MSTSTFERMMENEQWKAEFEKGYEEFLISKFLCQQMEHSNLSVRELAPVLEFLPPLSSRFVPARPKMYGQKRSCPFCMS